MFHTHTISGIIISAALYVIFFTGSISFLRDEINAWERNEPIPENYFETVDYDTGLKKINEKESLYGRDITFNHRYFERRITTSLSPSKDPNTKPDPKQGRGRRGSFFYMDMENFKQRNYTETYSLGEFFYRLHFFAQLNFFGRSGYFLSGMVAFFFLFVVLTGVIVHWKKIVNSFFVFRPKAKWKAIWTDAHVALGMIGLPYQFMFAVTGAYLIIGYTVMLPPVQSIIYGDDAKKVQEVMLYDEPLEYDFSGTSLEASYSINHFIELTKEKWPELQLNELKIFNYGDANMHVKVTGSPTYSDKLLGTGYAVYKVANGALITEKNPYGSTSYMEGATDILKRLHFGDYGGYGMKLIYFVLGLITCFVILSGVLIWLVARDKKNVPEYKRSFNTWLVRIYVAISLSLYPITAAIFVAIKVFGDYFPEDRKTFIYQVFFYGWLGLSVLFTALRNNYLTNKLCLLLGAIIGLLVPIANGIVTGNWLWISWEKGYSQIFVVDLFWLLLSLTAIAVLVRLKKPQQQTTKPAPKRTVATS